ncbi:LacI family transcriptional regulator [Nakamurella antarctica]|uniref:LacI family transcriptional regulator n=1 Tax=Nakamurella antarctica TaxID=1902245 RepID=A0A3G8ZMN0_9ACTN|nr:LacI family DNA-binding transcriptional regulator [Nakamurella antarctica]AZI58602.1 LacI family transcriptional regulator [Nakamurella antarctica]
MPDRGRPTLRDIAADTGLSSATVSYALRGLHVPENTQARVRESAERLGYQVDPIARALASGRTGYVGILVGSQADMWQQSVASALGRGLLGAGLHALVVDAGNDADLEASLAQRLVDQRVDALIVMPVNPRGAHWPTIAQRTVLVSIGDSLPRTGTAAEVVFDNAAGVTDAMNRLAAAGHKRITVLTPSAVSTPDKPAEEVVKDLAEELGVSVDVCTAPHDMQGATEVALAILRGDAHPTAFLCLADSIAFGVYAASRELGLRIPEDLSVVGFDDRPVSALLTPPLATYSWPVDDLVAEVVERTVHSLETGKRSRKRTLTATPQIRASLGQMPGAR